MSVLTPPSSPRRVFWEWNVHSHSFEAQVQAAAAGGFDVLTVPLRKYRAELAGGKSARELLSIASSNGIVLDYLDGASCWTSTRYPPGAADWIRAALDFSVDEALAMCEALRLKHVVAIAGFEAGAIPMQSLVDQFGAFCVGMARYGIWVDLEPMPMLGIPTLRLGWDIVSQAGQPNSGVLLDTWHFMRGDPDLEVLRSIPAGGIVNVQLADALRTPQGTSLWEDAARFRKFPGEGEFPIVEILAILRQKGALRSIGPEILSAEIDALAPVEAGRHASQTTAEVMRRAGFP